MKGKPVIAPLFLGAFALLLLPSSLSAAPPPDLDWRHYGNDLANTRFQNVDQINPGNASRLRVAWVFHTGVLDEKAELQASPIVINGRMFVTDGHDDVFALNAATGHKIWAHKPGLDFDNVVVCCGRNNKGVAFGDGKIFHGRLDDVVVALNANTGKVVWSKRVTVGGVALKPKDGYAINNAPQFVENVPGLGNIVIISVSGGEFEIRGQVFALRASDGEQMWRFATTDPVTYGGDQFKKGGAAVWNPPAIDRDLNLLYVVTGNAAPDILGEDRPGQNLFATSIVALNLTTGEPRWHFQAVHHDIWDYDSAQPPVLFPARGRPALGHCSKNGQYYILDRRNGTPIFPVTEVPAPPEMPAPGKTPFQKVFPTQPVSAVEPLTPLTFVRPNDTGFPAKPQYTPPGNLGQEFVMVPGDDGGCEWNPAAFSPRTKFIYYGTRYEPTTFKTFEGNRQPLPNGLHLGSTFTNRVPGSHPFGLFGATDTTTGKIAWKIEVPIPTKSGLAIGGDVVFFGEGNGKFHAADAVSGRILFTFDPRSSKIRNVGGAQASPAVYVADGREFVAYAFGGNVPDRNNFANLDGENPDAGRVGDAIIAFALPRGDEGDDDDDGGDDND